MSQPEDWPRRKALEDEALTILAAVERGEVETHPWDPVDHLVSIEDVILYIEATLEENTAHPEVVAKVLEDVGRALKKIDIAEDAADSAVYDLVKERDALLARISELEAANK
jgi:hypothetical protein